MSGINCPNYQKRERQDRKQTTLGSARQSNIACCDIQLTSGSTPLTCSQGPEGPRQQGFRALGPRRQTCYYLLPVPLILARWETSCHSKLVAASAALPPRTTEQCTKELWVPKAPPGSGPGRKDLSGHSNPGAGSKRAWALLCIEGDRQPNAGLQR